MAKIFVERSSGNQHMVFVDGQPFAQVEEVEVITGYRTRILGEDGTWSRTYPSKKAAVKAVTSLRCE